MKTTLHMLSCQSLISNHNCQLQVQTKWLSSRNTFTYQLQVKSNRNLLPKYTCKKYILKQKEKNMLHSYVAKLDIPQEI